MIVYLFKFDRNTAENGANNELLNFIHSQVKNEGDVFNYAPSRNKIVLGVQTSIYKELCDYIRDNVGYDFEFEEHTDDERSLTQFRHEPKSFAVQYMLALFRPEQILEL